MSHIPGVATRFNATTAAAARARKASLRRERIAIFVEVLSDVGEVKATCRQIGISETTGTAYMALIRADLGWQAR